MKNVKKNGGFTLVELIVVIAILAILAAVAIPAYSGYIAKAEEANDLQLLGALNTSFNAACVENNIFDMDTMENSQFELTNGLITGLSIPGGSADVQLSNVTYTNAVAESLLESFMLYYGENKTTAFKVFEMIIFKDGAFVGYDAEEAEGVVIGQLKELLGASSYTDLKAVSGEVDSLVGDLAAYLTGNTSVVGTGFATYLTELGIDPDDENYEQTAANAAVLYISKNATTLSDETIATTTQKVNDLLYKAGTGGGITEADLNAVGAGMGSQLAGYAAVYAAAEGIMLENKEAFPEFYEEYKAINMNGPQGVIEAINMAAAVAQATGGNDIVNPSDPSAKIEDAQISANMEAYFKTLQALNSKEGEFENNLSNAGLFSNSAIIQDLIAQLEN